jgi:hypothetical protein
MDVSIPIEDEKSIKKEASQRLLDSRAKICPRAVMIVLFLLLLMSGIICLGIGLMSSISLFYVGIAVLCICCATAIIHEIYRCHSDNMGLSLF